MGVSFQQLRERSQLPVRHKNDVAGLLYGDKFSLPITKLFVDRGWSPDFATIGMLVTGLVGSAILALAPPGVPMLLGAVLLLLYYVCDCVDGEVARYRGIEDMRWGYYDYLFHMLVKPCAFAGVGIGLWRQTGGDLFLFAAGTATVAALWLKMFLDAPGILFLRAVLAGKPGRDPSFRRFYRSLRPDLSHPGDDDAHPGDGRDDADDDDESKPPAGFPLGFNTVTIRALITNFDMGLLVLVFATAGDLLAGPFPLPLVGSVPLRALWLLWYGVILPLDFLDYLRTYVARGHFPSETERLLTLAHHFRAPPQEGEGADEDELAPRPAREHGDGDPGDTEDAGKPAD